MNTSVNKLAFLLFCLVSFNALVQCQFDLQDYGVITDNKHRGKYLWGTYKPNLYFSMKNRRNTSDVFGIMWYGAEYSDFKTQGDLNTRLRHNCRMEDNLNYRWEAHNGLDYGSQVIEDKANGMNLNSKFIKTEYNHTDHQSWNAYLKGDIQDNKKISILLYVAMENFEISDKSFFNFTDANFNSDNIVINGMEKGKQKYTYNVHFGESTKLVSKSFQKYRKRYNETWRVKKYVYDDLHSSESKLNTKEDEWTYASFNTNKNINAPNIVVIQLLFDSKFEIFIDFSTSHQSPSNNQYVKDSLNEKEKEFNEKFDKIYWNRLSLSNFNGIPLNSESDKLLLREMATQALSNILGGIGYFWGAIKINLDGKLEEGKYHKGFRYAIEEKGLYTGTPSRSFFARGFLWDEGFHNIIISQWDVDISIDILDSWLSTMSATGWMAREQIRGSEAESQVPAKFIIQNKLIANPPTFILPLENILNYYKFNNEDKKLKTVNAFLKKCFDKFGAWYEWFEIYQKSTDRKSYQWQGRNSEHNLASGLDDYPRGMTPNIYERHLDLTIWVMELIKSLRNLSELFDYELVSHFDKQYKKLLKELPDSNFDKEKGLYNDYLGPQFNLIKSEKFSRAVPPYLWRGDGRCGAEAPNPLGQPSECNPYSDMPCCSEFGWCGSSTNHCNCQNCKRSEKLENRSEFKNKANIFNPHLGYVNLYPLFFGVLKTDEQAFRNTLQLLKSKDELLSDFGIRSLSKKDLLYHSGEDYWRGNIWMNINFLTLRGLYKHYKHDTEALEVYKLIRNNLIKNIFKQWKVEKTFYEQYSDIDGKGLKARPFNGWTSLILNIITEKYDN